MVLGFSQSSTECTVLENPKRRLVLKGFISVMYDAKYFTVFIYTHLDELEIHLCRPSRLVRLEMFGV